MVGMRAGVGYSNQEDAFLAGRRAVQEAMAAGRISSPDLVLAFCCGNLDHFRFYQGIRSVIGDEVPVVGGSAIGVITNHHLSYSGHPAAIAVLQSEGACFRVEAAGDIHRGARQAGVRMARALSGGQDPRALLVFYDSIKVRTSGKAPPVLNPSSHLIEGMEEGLGNQVPILGAGLLGDYSLAWPVYQFCGFHAARQAVAGIMFTGDIIPYFRIMHGCTPLDGVYREITNMEGANIYELDGRPIVEVIDGLYGDRRWRDQHPVELLTIGVNHAGRFEEPREDCYVNRLITGVLPGDSGIGIFEPDLDNGTEIQFMLRDADKMIRSARYNARRLMDRVTADGRKAAFAMYIDCAGRTAAYSKTPVEEASEVQKVLNRHGVPLLGFYSGVEIAPLLGKSRGLDWTGVLILFTVPGE